MTSPESPPSDSSANKADFWNKSLKITFGILCFWAFISLGCGVLFREFLDANAPNVGAAPFGFWMAQQGSIIGFLILLVVYMLLMNRLDSTHGYGGEEDA